jgi:hypothetical protein
LTTLFYNHYHGATPIVRRSVDKPQLDALREQIWSKLAKSPYVPRIPPDEALTLLGGWKTVLLADALLRRFERNRGPLEDAHKAFSLLDALIGSSGLKVLMTDGSEDEEEWAQLYVATIWLLRLVAVHKPEVVETVTHCYQLSTVVVPDDYRQAAKELVPEIAETAQRVLGDRWLD